jgi:hypothetical protein
MRSFDPQQRFRRPDRGYYQSGIGKDVRRDAVEANLLHKSIVIDLGAPRGARRTAPGHAAQHAVAPLPNHSFIACSPSIRDRRTVRRCCNDAVMTSR